MTTYEEPLQYVSATSQTDWWYSLVSDSYVSYELVLLYVPLDPALA